jgi:hypothetical protein
MVALAMHPVRRISAKAQRSLNENIFNKQL